jgi:hypothetical protein
MLIRKPIFKAVAMAMAATLFWLHAPVDLAVAAMIDTETLLQADRRIDSRERLASLFDREDVQAGFRAYGVDPIEARARAAAMTDAEVEMLAGQLDQLPAGGDALGAILFVGLFVFLVLLVTDIAGYTKVFPFVKPTEAR